MRAGLRGLRGALLKQFSRTPLLSRAWLGLGFWPHPLRPGCCLGDVAAQVGAGKQGCRAPLACTIQAFLRSRKRGSIKGKGRPLAKALKMLPGD